MKRCVDQRGAQACNKGAFEPGKLETSAMATSSGAAFGGKRYHGFTQFCFSMGEGTMTRDSKII